MNVLNVDKIEKQLKNIGAYSIQPEVKQWLLTTARNHILNLDGQEAEKEFQTYSTKPSIRGRYRETPTPDKLPAWAQKAVGDKKPVHHFDYIQPRRRDLWKTVDTIVDWFNTWSSDRPEFKRLSHISFTDAAKRAIEWKAGVDKSPWLHITDKPPTVKGYANGFKWVRLVSAMHMQREDQLMCHCCGGQSYVQGMKTGNQIFYSLRDPRNKPHVTMLVSKGTNGGYQTEQCKGNSNRKPADIYQGYINDFLKSQRIALRGDTAYIDTDKQEIPTQALVLPDTEEPAKQRGAW